jgi:aryl-alcohol dehydrogenase-like predicted oxidoreductase
MMLARLGLGTVQFGLEYGVSNFAGHPDEREIANILSRAVETGIGYIDTAPAYGNAESLVGRYLPRGHRLRIVTKAPAIADAVIEARHGQMMLDSLAASRDHMRVDQVHGFLVHHAADLAKPGWQHIVEAMAEVRARGWANRIGASIYNSDQLALVESRFAPELVQLPLNVLDRRPISSGMLARLKAQGTEIHARSVFLQGLLLMKPSELPDFFLPVRKDIAALQRRWAGQGRSPIAACLAFALQQTEVDAVIVGVNRCAEFEEIAALVQQMDGIHDEDAAPAVDPVYLDPSRWPSFSRQ